MYQKILVPLDGSKLSEAVLPYVRAMTATGESEVVLLQVPDYPIYDEKLMDAELVSMVRRHVDAETRGYLSAIAGDLQSNGRKVSCTLGKGDVAEAILDWAERVKADLTLHTTSSVSSWPAAISLPPFVLVLYAYRSWDAIFKHLFKIASAVE